MFVGIIFPNGTMIFVSIFKLFSSIFGLAVNIAFSVVLNDFAIEEIVSSSLIF